VAAQAARPARVVRPALGRHHDHGLAGPFGGAGVYAKRERLVHEQTPGSRAAIVTDKSRPSNLWTRAAYHEGLNALYNVETDETKKTSYYTYAVKWGDSHSWPWPT